MSIIPQRKKERINKKVIPHLRKAIEWYHRDKLQRAEQELTIAISNYKKEKTRASDITRDFAALYNNLASKYFFKKNYDKAFRLLLRALKGKQESIPNDIDSIKGTLNNLLNAGLLTCKFDELLNVVKELFIAYSDKSDFKNYLVSCIEKIERVQKNEPELMVAGMQIASFNFTTPIGDLVYFPKAFEEIEPIFGSQLILTDHKTLECSFNLKIPETGSKTIVPFMTDSWKKSRPSELESKIANSAPIFVVLLSENAHIPSNSVQVKDTSGRLVKFSFGITFTEFYIPSSYPRFGYSFGNPAEIPNCKSYKYFRGKAAIIEWELNSGEEYQIQLSVKNYEQRPSSDDQFSLRLGILLPFKKIAYSTSCFKHTNKIFVDGIQARKIGYFDDRDRPNSLSLQYEPTSISENHFTNTPFIEMDSGKQTYDITPTLCKNDNDYSVFGVFLRFRVAKEMMSIATIEWEQPIPTALSHLLLDKLYGFPPLCQYDIVNNSKREVNLSFKTEIEGYSTAQEENRLILPYSSLKINHTPLFKQSISSLSETCKASLRLNAAIGNESVLKKTIEITLLAFDTMIFEILNTLTRQVFNLHEYLTVWVTPHHKEVERIVSLAKEYHPQRVLQGYPVGSSDIDARRSTNLQVEAIFMALKEIGISYVDASLSFGWSEPFASQRVKLPATSIRTKSANCLDGTVLFASMLEYIGLQPIIVLIPRHAIIGWRPTPNSEVLEFLETTQTSSMDFATAVRGGRAFLQKGLDDARRVHQNPALTLENAVASGNIRFIDVASMRGKGIYPQSQSD